MTSSHKTILTKHDCLGFALVAAMFHMIYYCWMFEGFWASDLSAFYMAGLAVAQGTPEVMYDAPLHTLGGGVSDSVRQLMEVAGLTGDDTPPYLYPPLWAYMMAPLTHLLPAQTFFNVMMGAQSFMLGVMPWIGYRIARTDHVGAPLWLMFGFAVLLTSSTSLTAIVQNQLQITVGFVTMLALLAYRSGKARTAGVILGLAAALKIAPAFFGMLFLVRRDWCAIVAMAVTGIGLLMASLWLGGVDLHLSMLERLSAIDEITLNSRVNFSPEMVLYELRRVVLGLPAEASRLYTFPVLDAPVWLEFLPKLCLLGSVLWLAVAQWRGSVSFALQALFLSLAIGLFGPLSWAHYFVVPLMLLPAIFNEIPPKWTRLWLLAAALLPLNALFRFLIQHSEKVLWAAFPATIFFIALWLQVGVLLAPGRKPRVNFPNESPL